MTSGCPPPRQQPLAEDGGRCFDDAAIAQMERFVTDFGRMYRERNDALREVTRAHHSALLLLSAAADLRDGETGTHMLRIGYLAEALALALGQPEGYASMLRKAAPMHDIGKIGTPDRVLKKAGSLSPDERSIMNGHAANGARILGHSSIPLFRMAAEVALTHHERYDGTGYPSGLAGHDIPLCGRITAVVDFFDALTMDRVYRPAFAVDDALRMLAAERGRAFDPMVVDAFMRNASEIDALRCRITQECPSFDTLVDSP